MLGFCHWAPRPPCQAHCTPAPSTAPNVPRAVSPLPLPAPVVDDLAEMDRVIRERLRSEVMLVNTVAGLRSVPAEVNEAATAMGYSSASRFWRVQLPLAQPTAFAGLRVAAVSTVALVTVGFVVGYGGLGNLIDDGLDTFFRPQVLTATVLCVLLAVLFDLVVLGIERLATPWRRQRTGGS